MGKILPRCRRLYQYSVVVAGLFNTISVGMTFGWTSPMIPTLLGSNSEIPMTNEESSWVVIAILPGIVIGATLGGFLINRIGRKYTLLATAIPILTASPMMAFTRSLPLLICSRIVGGIGDGLLFSTFLIYVSEISDPEFRGCFATSIFFADAFGSLLINIIGSFCSYFVTALWPALTPILLLLMVYWLPESPYYLIMKGKTNEAKSTLQAIRGRDNVDNDFALLMEAVQNEKRSNFRQIARSKKLIFIALGLILVHLFVGGNPVLFYAQTIFEETAAVLAPVLSSSIYISIQAIMVIVSATLVDRIGRRPLLITSTTGALVSLLLVGVYFSLYNETNTNVIISWIPIFGLVMYVIAYNLGLHSIPLILLNELFPPEIKAPVVSFSMVFYAAMSAVATKVFQVNKDYFGIHVSFLFFAGSALLGLVHIILFVPETKEKTLEEIQAQINRNGIIKKQKDTKL